MPDPRILASAWEDISAIADYHLAAVGQRSAEAVTEKLLGTVELLGDHPYLGPLHSDPVLQAHGYRKLVCEPYVCVYRIVDGIPTVYRVFHGSRNYPSKM